MIRDDKDPTIGSNLYNYFNNMGGVTDINSDFGYTIPLNSASSSAVKKTINGYSSTLNDVSHDQLVQLLTGLRLTLLFLDGSEYYTYAGTRYQLTDMAKTIATLVLDYMSTGSSLNNLANQAYVENLAKIPSSAEQWVFSPYYTGLTDEALHSPASPFANPTTNNFPWLFQNPVIQQPSSIENNVGASFPIFLSEGYAELGSKLTSKTYFTTKLAKEVWRQMFTTYSSNIYTANDAWKILTIATLSDAWSTNYIPCGFLVPLPCWIDNCPLGKNSRGKCRWDLHVPILSSCPINIPCINKGAIIYDQCWKAKFEILPLMFNIINNHSGYDNFGDYDNFYNTVINAAPCRGPYCNSATDKFVGWASWNMFHTVKQNGDASLRYTGAPSSSSSDWGEYNGLDYMLMFNLYNMYHGYNYYYNNYDNNLTLNNRVVIVPEYYTARSFTDNTGAAYNGVITSTNITVNSGAYLNLRAGSSITLSPPFIVNGIMEASIHSAVNNLDWEMTICSDGVPASGVSPSGHRETSTNQQNYFSMSDYVANKPNTQIESVDNLGDSYPNPSGSITKIPYTISTEESASIVLTDSKGATVATILKKDVHPIGAFTVEYNTSNLSPGIYYYTLKTPSSSQTKKLVVVN